MIAPASPSPRVDSLSPSSAVAVVANGLGFPSPVCAVVLDLAQWSLWAAPPPFHLIASPFILPSFATPWPAGSKLALSQPVHVVILPHSSLRTRSIVTARPAAGRSVALSPLPSPQPLVFASHSSFDPQNNSHLYPSSSSNAPLTKQLFVSLALWSAPSLASSRATLRPRAEAMAVAGGFAPQTPTPRQKHLHQSTLLMPYWFSPEHVLRSSSNGSVATTARGKRSSSLTTTAYDGFEQPSDDIYRPKTRSRHGRHSKYSPTPSIKRGKVERLLKEHGSPPGVRVTAGGRIVQEGLTPLTSPRFNQNASSYLSSLPQVPKLEPQQVPSMDALRQLQGYLVNIGGGHICQVIDGKLIPVGVENGPLRLLMPPSNVAATPALPVAAPCPFPTSAQQFAPPGAVPVTPQSPLPPLFAALAGSMNHEVPNVKQLKTLEDVHGQLDHELKELDRNEVLQRESLTSANRAEIAKQRVLMTNRLDECRRGMIELRRVLNIPSPKEAEKQPKPAFKPGPPTNWYQTQAYHMLPFAPDSTTPVAPITPSWSGGHPGFEFAPQPVIGTAAPQDLEPAPGFDSAPGSFFSTSAQQYEGFDNTPPNTASKEGFDALFELQQRADNAGIGIMSQPVDCQPQDGDEKSRVTSTLGSKLVHEDVGGQGRRSRAIAIKKPEERSSRPKTTLDPTSPSYQPASMVGDQVHSMHGMNSSRVRPPPGVLMNTENINHNAQRQAGVQHQMKKSPGQHDGAGPEGSDDGAGLRTSDSSATTADFFPQDPHLHSANKWSFSRRDDQVNLPAWMARDGLSNDHPTSLNGGRSKFLLNDSPEDQRYINPPHSTERPQTALHLSHLGGTPSFENNQPPGELHRDTRDFVQQPVKASPETRRFRSSHQQEETAINDIGTDEFAPKTCSISMRLEKAKQKAESSPNKTDAYWDGYKLALMKGLLTDSSNGDFCKGYCDAIADSNKRHNARSSDEHSDGRQPVSAPSQRLLSGGIESGTRVPSMSRAASLPLMEVPKAPPNSAVDSPLRQSVESCNQAASISFDSALTTPKRMVDLSQSMSAREIGTQTSNLQLRHTEPLSPLAKRYSGNQVQPPVGSERKVRTFSPPGIGSLNQQRYQTKVPASVAQCPRQARKYPPQYDGSADDDEKLLTDKPTNVQEPTSIPTSPTSPSGKGKTKVQAPGSPVRRASSAVGQLLQLGGKSKKSSVQETVMDPGSFTKTKDKDVDPAKLSSPEKAKWRAKWKKNFALVKEEEDKEIAKYQKENPTSHVHRIPQ